MAADLLFCVGVALLLTHELDAIQRHEWRIFPFICRLKDDTAYYVFTVLHVPLFVLLLWLMCHPSENVRYGFQVSMDVFFIVHLGLHQLLKSHPKYEFTGLFSRAIILLLAIAGFAHSGLLFGLRGA